MRNAPRRPSSEVTPGAFRRYVVVMDEDLDDVVCPECGAEIVYEREGPDMTGAEGDLLPVGCANPRCVDKSMMWAPAPREEYEAP